MREWREVAGTTDVFVNREGEVAKIKDGAIKHKYKTFVSNKGYMRTRLVINDKRTNVYIHRIVYEAFKGIPKNKIIHHRDTDKTNNHLSNLKAVTHSENVLIEFREGRRKRRLNHQQVKYILSTSDELSAVQLAKKYHCSPSLIRLIRWGERYQDVLRG